jgi:hypothetical protein
MPCLSIEKVGLLLGRVVGRGDESPARALAASAAEEAAATAVAAVVEAVEAAEDVAAEVAEAASGGGSSTPDSGTRLPLPAGHGANE